MSRPRQDDVAEVDGVVVPLGPHLSPELRARLIAGRYEVFERRAARSYLRRSDVVLELGAGLGVVSALCAKIVGSENVFAFEANPALEEPIRKLYAANGVSPKLDICILAAERGTARLNVSEEFCTSSTAAIDDVVETVEVPTKSFAEIHSAIRPTFLIVDIEGGELELVRHAKLDGIRTIIMELHPRIIGKRGRDEVITRLRRARFRVDASASTKSVIVHHRAFSREDMHARRARLAGLLRSSLRSLRNPRLREQDAVRS